MNELSASPLSSPGADLAFLGIWGMTQQMHALTVLSVSASQSTSKAFYYLLIIPPVGFCLESVLIDFLLLRRNS